MKAQLLLMLLISLSFASCQSNHAGEKKTGVLSNFLTITDNEDKGIKEVISFYGGQCEYGYGKKVSLENDNPTNFWLKVSKSPSIDSLATIAEMPASNVAYLFYKNLDKEKNNYNEIQVELIFTDGKERKFSYTPSQLEKVKVKMNVIDKIVGLIRNKNFQAIKGYIKADTLFNVDKDKLVSTLEQIEPEFGNAKEFMPYGFRFSSPKDGKTILHISGAMIRDKKSHYFSASLDPNSSKEEIYYLNYDL